MLAKTSIRFRPMLEGFEERLVPDATVPPAGIIGDPGTTDPNNPPAGSGTDGSDATSSGITITTTVTYDAGSDPATPGDPSASADPNNGGPAAAPATKTVTINFGPMSTTNDGKIKGDTITIKITQGNTTTTLTVDVGAGNTTDVVATNVVAAIKAAGYANATANGSSVTFSGSDIGVTVSHTNPFNDDPSMIVTTQQ